MSEERIHGDEGYIPEKEREAAENAIDVGRGPGPSEEAEESERALAAVGAEEPQDPDLIEVELDEDEFAEDGGVP
jgi:hypothetical protein